MEEHGRAQSWQLNTIKDFVKRGQKAQADINAMGFGVPQPTISQFPHCDQRVLHAPGHCQYCDAHPDWQELREAWGINFTGGNDPTKMTCPAEKERPLGIINHWGGNVPTENVIEEEPDAV